MKSEQEIEKAKADEKSLEAKTGKKIQHVSDAPPTKSGKIAVRFAGDMGYTLIDP